MQVAEEEPVEIPVTEANIFEHSVSATELVDEVVISVPETIHVDEATIPSVTPIAHVVSAEDTPVVIPESEAAIFENNVSATVLEDEAREIPVTIQHVEEATVASPSIPLVYNISAEEESVVIPATEAAVFENTVSATTLEDEIVISVPETIHIGEAILPQANAIEHSFVTMEGSTAAPVTAASIFESVDTNVISEDKHVISEEPAPVVEAPEFRTTTIMDDSGYVVQITEHTVSEAPDYVPVVLTDEVSEETDENKPAEKNNTKISTIPTIAGGKVKTEEPMIPTLPSTSARGVGSNTPETPFVLPATEAGRATMAKQPEPDDTAESSYTKAINAAYDIPVAPTLDRDAADSENQSMAQFADTSNSADGKPNVIVADSEVEINYDGDEADEPEIANEEPVVEPEAEPVEEPITEPEEEVVEENSVEESAEVIEEPVEETLEEETEEVTVEEPTEEPIEEAIEEEPMAVIVEEPEAEPIEEPEQVIHTDAIHADELMSDEEAEEHIEIIEEEPGKERTGKMEAVNLDTICDHFEDGDVVTLEALQEKKLISKKSGRVKILARGTMTKKLEIIADTFSLQAVKMITLAGGKSEQYK